MQLTRLLLGILAREEAQHECRRLEMLLPPQLSRMALMAAE